MTQQYMAVATVVFRVEADDWTAAWREAMARIDDDYHKGDATLHLVAPAERDSWGDPR